jgi:hypothetical protein
MNMTYADKLVVNNTKTKLKGFHTQKIKPYQKQNHNNPQYSKLLHQLFFDKLHNKHQEFPEIFTIPQLHIYFSSLYPNLTLDKKSNQYYLVCKLLRDLGVLLINEQKKPVTFKINKNSRLKSLNFKTFDIYIDDLYKNSQVQLIQAYRSYCRNKYIGKEKLKSFSEYFADFDKYSKNIKHA